MFPRALRATCYRATCWEEHSLSGWHCIPPSGRPPLSSAHCYLCCSACVNPSSLCFPACARLFLMHMRVCAIVPCTYSFALNVPGIKWWHVIDVHMSHGGMQFQMFRLCELCGELMFVSGGRAWVRLTLRLNKDWRSGVESKYFHIYFPLLQGYVWIHSTLYTGFTIFIVALKCVGRFKSHEKYLNDHYRYILEGTFMFQGKSAKVYRSVFLLTLHWGSVETLLYYWICK